VLYFDNFPTFSHVKKETVPREPSEKKDLTRENLISRPELPVTPVAPMAVFSQILQKFLKKGIDFLEIPRYNMELYESLGTGGVIMPNIKSSKKDVISSKIAYEKNKANKSALKTTVKKFDAALVSGDKAAAQAAYVAAVKAVDQAVNKGLLHKNNAARKKSSMTLKLNKLA
jgi:small subunit ribosomal protein S20